MNVTRDVVKDLLPVVLAGEASPDTRALVEEWLRSDRDLAREAEAASRIELPASPPLHPTIEKQALDRTRRRLRWRSILFGVAIYVTFLPLTVTFGSDGYHGLLIDNWPERIAIGAVAIAIWFVYWRVRRSARTAGV